jgi:chromosome segregation ATPase
MTDTAASVQPESRLEMELGRLKSRLAQGKRDHQRSHDELQRLEADIRDTEGELRTYRRDNPVSAYTEEQLAGACGAVVSALREGPNPQTYAQLSGVSRLDPRLVALAATRLTREGRATIKQPRSEADLVSLARTSP